jgi:hypothetical protein
VAHCLPTVFLIRDTDGISLTKKLMVSCCDAQMEMNIIFIVFDCRTWPSLNLPRHSSRRLFRRHSSRLSRQERRLELDIRRGLLGSPPPLSSRKEEVNSM